MGKIYSEFLERKAIVDVPTGHSPGDLNNMLFDFQREITAWAIRRGRAAIFADCGLGKTPMQLAWADAVVRHTNKPTLILAPLAVSKQTKREGEKFGFDVNICRSDVEVKKGINIANYEMLHNFNPTRFGSIVLDESSILKSYTGKYRNQIISALLNSAKSAYSNLKQAAENAKNEKLPDFKRADKGFDMVERALTA